MLYGRNGSGRYKSTHLRFQQWICITFMDAPVFIHETRKNMYFLLGLHGGHIYYGTTKKISAITHSLRQPAFHTLLE